MFDKGRHNSHTQQHQQARYHLRQGIAKEALVTKVTGKPAVDSVGRPLLYSNEMAERHNAGTLEKWARGYRATSVVSGMAFCRRCHRIPEACRCPAR